MIVNLIIFILLGAIAGWVIFAEFRMSYLEKKMDSHQHGSDTSVVSQWTKKPKPESTTTHGVIHMTPEREQKIRDSLGDE